MKIDKKTERILTNSIFGKISAEEHAQLDAWINASVAHRREAEAWQGIWEKSKRLVYSDSFDLERLLKKTKKRIPEFRKKRSMRYFRQAAAIIVLTIGFSGLIRYYQNQSQMVAGEKQNRMEVKTACGTQTNFSLPDGTEVWLNSGSTLRYPGSFNGDKARSIELSGEGYFKVKRSPGHPFIVKTPEIDIQVLGTEFNVSAYTDFGSVTVAVATGKVSILSNSGKQKKALLVMHPNEVIEYNKEENRLYHLREKSLGKYTAWRDGIIMFYGDPIETVIHKLEKWYNVEITLADESLTRYRFTATFENETIDQVLNLLSMSTPLKYEMIPAKRKPDHSFSKRIIIISDKKTKTAVPMK
jgi:transmembrane sensor